MPAQQSTQDQLYEEAATSYGPALERLARAYEADVESRRDLLQEIHISVWRSFELFDQRCSMRTWIYRVAHNVASSHVLRDRRSKLQTLVGVEELDNVPWTKDDPDRRQALDRLLGLIQQLKPLDRNVILSYLEGLDAAEISEITGLKPGNIATKIHRIKGILARRFQGGNDNE